MLRGRSAIVTGSTSGIGLGIANALAQAGANVMLNGFGATDHIECIRDDPARRTRATSSMWRNWERSPSCFARRLAASITGASMPVDGACAARRPEHIVGCASVWAIQRPCHRPSYGGGSVRHSSNTRTVQRAQMSRSRRSKIAAIALRLVAKMWSAPIILDEAHALPELEHPRARPVEVQIATLRAAPRARRATAPRPAGR